MRLNTQNITLGLDPVTLSSPLRIARLLNVILLLGCFLKTFIDIFDIISRIPRTVYDTSEHIRFLSLLFLFATVSFPRCRLILLMWVSDLIQNSISFHVV